MTVEGFWQRSHVWGTLADMLLPDGTNVNHTLVKEGWYWWHKKYAPADTVDLPRRRPQKA